MSLLEHRDEGIHTVRWVRTDAIGVDGRELGASFLLAPDRIEPSWSPTRLDEIDEAAIQAVLALQPAVILLGTGAVQQLPSAALLARFLAQGIGLEAMDNAAAARTFNLLASEGRRVVAAFLLPGG
jgi:uncharacterized protein